MLEVLVQCTLPVTYNTALGSKKTATYNFIATYIIIMLVSKLHRLHIYVELNVNHFYMLLANALTIYLTYYMCVLMNQFPVDAGLIDIFNFIHYFHKRFSTPHDIWKMII